MASPSKEENILRIILENSPLTEWHFEQITKEAKVTKAVCNKWLKKYVSSGLLKRVKQKGKFPHYSAGINNPIYQSMKKIYSLEKLHNSGLIAKLLSLKSAKTIILFGSMAKGDWHKESDIDLFIIGKIDDFDKNKYETKLQRHIDMWVYETINDLKKIRSGLVQNVTNGYVIKGQIQDIAKVS